MPVIFSRQASAAVEFTAGEFTAATGMQAQIWTVLSSLFTATLLHYLLSAAPPLHSPMRAREPDASRRALSVARTNARIAASSPLNPNLQQPERRLESALFCLGFPASLGSGCCCLSLGNRVYIECCWLAEKNAAAVEWRHP
ncbi:hypothetical protein MRX96_007364 [Rhipicephalus microplus]